MVAPTPGDIRIEKINVKAPMQMCVVVQSRQRQGQGPVPTEAGHGHAVQIASRGDAQSAGPPQRDGAALGQRALGHRGQIAGRFAGSVRPGAQCHPLD
ncbi:hypothetical protein THIX_30005 [Thiomonas sp. X19]|nr:hypothetical protein THIX_30005 [Thiomonas sp. X19]